MAVSDERKPLLYPVNGSPIGNKLSRDPHVAPKVPGIPKRYIVTFLGFLGFVNVYALRVNLSVALVDMVTINETVKANETVECPGFNDTSTVKVGEFQWDTKTQGIVLGAFFYGYVTTQIPGGWLGENFGGKKLFGFGVLATSVLTLLTPLAARFHLGVLIAVRVLEGIGEGVTFPAMHAMFGKWAPVWERTRLVSFAYAGAQMGTVISLPISGILCASGFLGGWPSVFYIFGSLGCLWFAVWMFFVSDTPAQHSTISVEEKTYIETSIGSKPQRYKTPWLGIFTSMPFWAILVAHFCSNWGYYTMLTCLPTYMADVMHFNIKENGLLSALPYFCCWLWMTGGGFMVDYIRQHKYLTTVQVRKIANTFGFLTPACFLVAASYSGCDTTLGVTFLTLAVGLSGIYMSGYNVNHLDIAPRFAGTLMGLTNCTATIPGFLGPIVVGYITSEKQTQEQWRIVFYIAGGIYIFGALFFLIFAAGEVQPWADESMVIEIYPEVEKRTHDLPSGEITSKNSPPEGVQ